jgi:hypothetical protein
MPCTLSKFLDFTSCTVTDVTAVASTIFGFIAVMVALYTYRQSARASKLAHMHQLFSGFLRVRIEWAEIEVQRGNDCDSLSEKDKAYGTLKMYTLEEMWLWLKAAYPITSQDSFWSNILSRLLYRNQKASYDAWLNTIVIHIKDNKRLGQPAIEHNSDAYTKDFRNLCNRTWEVRERQSVQPADESATKPTRLQRLVRQILGRNAIELRRSTTKPEVDIDKMKA